MKLRSLLLAAILAAGCQPAESPLPIVGTLERDRLELVAEARERIVEINVREGDKVAEGDVLLRLDASLVAADLQLAAARLEGAEQRFAELVRGPRSEQIDRARAELDAAGEVLRTARREHERVRTLYERRVMTAADLDRAEGEVEVAAANVAAAEAGLAELLEGTTREQLGQARASVSEAEAAIDRLRLLADRHVLRAPRPGRIESLPYELGERPAAGAVVAVMLAGERPYARVYIPEPLRARVNAGLEARVSVDGIDGAFAGEVRWVSSEAAFTPYFALTQRDRSRLTYAAEITLTEPRAAELPAGVPVQVEFPSLQPANGTGSQ